MLSCANDETFMATAIAVIILMFVPICIPMIKKIPGFNMAKITSLGAGLSTASVFAFFLPDLIGKIPHVAEHTNIVFLQNIEHLTFFVFVAFLLAFCTMYTLEKVATNHTKNNQPPSYFLFCVHMTIVCMMLVLLSSSFPAMAKTSYYIIGVVCALAAFEIFLEEASLNKHFSSIYSSEGRVIISFAIVVGWIAGIKLFGHETTVITLFAQAFAMGMILTAIVKCEFDLINQENNYMIFIISVVVKTCIIFALMLVGDSKKEEAEKANAALIKMSTPQKVATVAPATYSQAPTAVNQPTIENNTSAMVNPGMSQTISTNNAAVAYQMPEVSRHR